jgi:hypothetical protein
MSNEQWNDKNFKVKGNGTYRNKFMERYGA